MIPQKAIQLDIHVPGKAEVSNQSPEIDLSFSSILVPKNCYQVVLETTKLTIVSRKERFDQYFFETELLHNSNELIFGCWYHNREGNVGHIWSFQPQKKVLKLKELYPENAQNANGILTAPISCSHQ